MIIGIDDSTTKNKYKGQGVGVYTENMLKWLPRVSKDIEVETNLSKPFDVFLQPSFYDGFPNNLKCHKTVMVHDLTLLKFNYFSAWGPLVNFVKGSLYKCKLRMVRRADGILVNSDNTKKDVTEMLGVSGEKVKVAYLGLKEISWGKPARDVGQPREYLLYVGGGEFNKNLVRLVKAFLKMEEQRNSGLKLVLVGSQFVKKLRREVEILKEEIQKLGLENDVIFPGFVPDKDLASWYKKARAFVYPSFYEGFGLPVLEAMACGAPVVTSDSSSLPEIGGEAVLYFDPYDIDDMAAKIRRVISNESIRSKLSKKGLKQARKFTWEKCARETAEFFKTLK